MSSVLLKQSLFTLEDQTYKWFPAHGGAFISVNFKAKTGIFGKVFKFECDECVRYLLDIQYEIEWTNIKCSLGECVENSSTFKHCQL